MTQPLDYPAAERRAVDGPVPDPYRWLEDAAAPETAVWSRAQEELFETQRAGWPGLAAHRARLTALMSTGLVGVPVWRGAWRFFVRREPAQEHPVLLGTGPDGRERVLVDPTALDPSGTTTLDGWFPSWEGDRLAYTISRGGTEEAELYVLDVATGELLEGPVDRARSTSVGWLPGGEAFFFVRRLAPELVPAGEEMHHRRVYLHRVGSGADVEVVGAGADPTTYFGVAVSPDGRWLTVDTSRGTEPRNDVWLADLTAGPLDSPALKVVQQGLDAESYTLVRDGVLYVETDLDAPRRRLCTADPADPSPDRWRDLVPEDPEAVLEDFVLLDDVLVVARTRHAVGELTVHDRRTGKQLAVVGTGDAPGSVGGLTARPGGGHEAWFRWSDYSTPGAVFHYDARTGAVTPWAAAPGTAAVPAVSVRHEEYTSDDGTTVRMFVIAPTAEPDRPRPTVLYGYGGFSSTLVPGYSASILAWVAAGGVYAVAGLRGGNEEGEAWHRAGMRGAKQNVFDDFHAGAEHLIRTGRTTAGQLAASGGSNGGLLVGAALTQRPELFAAVVCSAPLLDMVRYPRHGLGRLWTDEYGDPEVPAELEWLLAYSPYHHVSQDTGYPAVLFTVFDGDTRVDPLHARKMCAALQNATSGGPVLIRAEGDVGHAASSVSRTIGLLTDTAGFLAAYTGLDLDA